MSTTLAQQEVVIDTTFMSPGAPDKNGDLDFMTHGQLHEVVFGFLRGSEILNYRELHSACNDVVLHFARTQLQDVVGQDLPLVLLPWQFWRRRRSVRTMDAALFVLLVRCGEDVPQILSTAAGGARSFGSQLFHAQDFRYRKTLEDFCDVCSVEVAQNLVHLELRAAYGAKVVRIMRLIAGSPSPLQSLYVQHNDGCLTDEVVRIVADNCPDLLTLDVGDSRGEITDASIKMVATNCRKLRSLDVSDTGGEITDPSIKLVARNRRQLQSLNVGETLRLPKYMSPDSPFWKPEAVVTDVSMKRVATYCVHLRSLNVSSTEGGITDETIKLLAMNCLQLEHLVVSNTKGKITDDSMKLVAVRCIQLQSLDVSHTEGMVTDDTIALVGLHCLQLQFLDVGDRNGKITDESIKVVAVNCQHLKSLTIGGSESITKASLRFLNPSCKVERYRCFHL